MINELHALFHSPEKGWDPVREEYAQSYADYAWSQTDQIEQEVAEIERRLGDLRGLRILDLGGGPGQYSCAFARRGADVTWRDVSRSYQRIVAARAKRERLHIQFSLGYMETADTVLKDPYDLVYSRVCWSYCRNDTAFARMFFKLVRNNGMGRIVFNTPSFDKKPSLWRRAAYVLYEYAGVKIGHLYATPEMMTGYFTIHAPRSLELNQLDPGLAALTFIK